jgi:predicted O-methyltransferase YrrM
VLVALARGSRTRYSHARLSCEDAGMRDHLHKVAAAPLRGLARLTGLRAGRHSARFMAEDVWGSALYLARSADRRAEREQAARICTSDECFDFSKAHFGGGPVQHRSEITALLKLAEENDTRVACEIGAFDAGTSVMLSRVLRPETLIVMDIYVKNRWRLRSDAPDDQTIHIIDGDSTHPLTVSRLRRKLRGRQIDLLLIDGDHTWAGVRQDFLSYQEFVRDGGLIAFHDICDVRDPASPGWSGDVPAFWRLLCSIYPTHEFVDSPDQQGLGIGVVRFDGTHSIAPVLSATPPGSGA